MPVINNFSSTGTRMIYKLKKNIHIIIGSFIFFTFSGNSTYDLFSEGQSINLPDHNIQKSVDIKGYKGVAFYNNGFLAVGTDGRIDHISKSGNKKSAISNCTTDLNCIVNTDQTIIVAGDEGTVLISTDGIIFNKAESGTDRNINGITLLNGILIAGADKGMILVSKNGTAWSGIDLQLKGNIVSVTANKSSCFGVTDYSEIIHSKDGINWKITDFNKEYSGYYKPCIFNKALLTDNRIVLIGKHNDGTPAVLFSTIGNVWTERLLNYTDDQGMPGMLQNIPNDITYDPVDDQFFLACEDGEILSLPSCTKCNVLSKVTGSDLNGIIYAGGLLLSVGDDFFVNILKIR